LYAEITLGNLQSVKGHAKILLCIGHGLVDIQVMLT
jgi:hypothetical protein